MHAQFGIALLVFTSALCLSECVTDSTKSPARSESALLRCIGESGYSPGAFDSLLESIHKNPPACPSVSVTQSPAPARKSSARTTADSAHYHGYVLDKSCHLINEFSGNVPDSLLRSPHRIMWTGMDSKGLPAVSGEYYLNVEFSDTNHVKDTVYSKIGWIQNPCAKN